MSKQELVCCPTLGTAAMAESQATELATMFKALGDPVRLRLLTLIACHAGGEACVCESRPPSTSPSPRSPITSRCCGGRTARLPAPRHLGPLLGHSGRAAATFVRPAPMSSTPRTPRQVHREPRQGPRPSSTLDRFLPVWIGAGHGRRAAAGPAGPRPGHALECGAGRRHLAADRPRPAGHDVSGAGQGPLRPARHRHRRPQAAGHARWC